MLLRFKVVVSSTKLPVDLILHVIEVHFRFIGTHFYHNQNTIKIFIFCLSHRSLWGYIEVSDPHPPSCTGGLLWLDNNFFWHPCHHTVLIHNLRVGKNEKLWFCYLSPLPSTRRVKGKVNSKKRRREDRLRKKLGWSLNCLQNKYMNVVITYPQGFDSK